jgi:hypothetical protein
MLVLLCEHITVNDVYIGFVTRSPPKPRLCSDCNSLLSDGLCGDILYWYFTSTPTFRRTMLGVQSSCTVACNAVYCSRIAGCSVQ